MSEQPERRAGRGQSGAERALVAAVRRAMLPSGGPDGVTFDWTAFERQFWSHVLEHQQRAEREPVTVS